MLAAGVLPELIGDGAFFYRDHLPLVGLLAEGLQALRIVELPCCAGFAVVEISGVTGRTGPANTL